jgi:hypothetical protein
VLLANHKNATCGSASATRHDLHGLFGADMVGVIEARPSARLPDAYRCVLFVFLKYR